MRPKTSSFRLGEEMPTAVVGAERPGLVLAYAPGVPPAERAYPTVSPVTLVGRDESAEVCLPADDAVSSRHAVIAREDGCLVVTDLGSRNGVFVNGSRVPRAELSARDVVRFGRTLFTVVLDGVDAHRDYLLDGTRRTDTEAEAQERRQRGFAGGADIDAIATSLSRAARSRVTVVLRGESGTGKEVFARYVHAQSGREGPFVAMNAAAIAPGLLEAELFGALRGAYSGADQERRGFVREAHRGTLFLDEIGDMPLEAQSRLLRVMQEREVVPVGASRPEKVDVRVVAATHRDLEALVAEGRFRGDLYARLREHEVRLPPLRDRLYDLVPLCRSLLARHGRRDVGLSVTFVERLLRYPFPYNVRELEHVVTRALALLKPGQATLTSADLPEALRGASSRKAAAAAERAEAMGPTTLSSPVLDAGAGPSTSELEAPAETLDGPGPGTLDRPTPLHGADLLDPARPPTPDLLRQMLAQHRGSVSSTARAFGVPRAKLYRWLSAAGIDAREFR